MSEELKIVFKYLLDFAKHPEEYNDDMVALLKVDQVELLLAYIDNMIGQLRQEQNTTNEFEKWLLGEKMMFYSGDGEKLIRYNETKNKWLELKGSDK